MEEEGIHVAQAGRHADKAEVDGFDLQKPGEIDGGHSLDHIEQQDHQSRHPATEAQHIGRPRIVGAMIPRIRQTGETGDQHSTG